MIILLAITSFIILNKLYDHILVYIYDFETVIELPSTKLISESFELFESLICDLITRYQDDSKLTWTIYVVAKLSLKNNFLDVVS